MTLLEQLRATYQALGEQLHQLELAAGTATSLSAISAPHPAPSVTIHSDGSSTEAIVDVAANFLMLRDSAGKALHNYRVPHGAPGGFCAEVGSTAQAYQSYFFQMGDKPELSVVRVDGTKSTIGDIGLPWIDPTLPAAYNPDNYPDPVARQAAYDAAGRPHTNQFGGQYGYMNDGERASTPPPGVAA
jgi:hypothetical protein